MSNKEASVMKVIAASNSPLLLYIGTPMEIISFSFSLYSIEYPR